jgi:uncharacterized lipoprotein YddW (UPF0748 family)
MKVSGGNQRFSQKWIMFRTLAMFQFMLLCSLGVCSAQAVLDDVDQPPPVRREFRAAWVATVSNIDWPSKPGLSTAEHQAELRALLDDAVRLNLNAIVLQVRTCCDALYQSKLEPWSEYLTGTMGQAPAPFYDPLEFAVEEAHKRGLELHAWFNPYRARFADAKAPASKDHISVARPELVKKYGTYLWMDPGEPEAREHTLAVIRDVVERYDIDGVHMDDYFYPYPVEDDKKNRVPFPDDPSWEKAQAAGNKLDRNDWRRENNNQLVSRIYEDIKRIKPWVKFGISPFGIGRPGKPAQIKGFDQYESLYADAEKWFTEGWVDYLTPQLYWRIGPPEQSYPALLQWWHQQNKAHRHLWPGNYTSRLLNNEKNSWPTDEVIAQIWVTRAQKGATGNVHFSMKALLRNAEGIADALIEGPYEEPALVPASPWLSESAEPLSAPKITVMKREGSWIVTRDVKADAAPWLWVVRTKHDGKWHLKVLPGIESDCPLNFVPKNESPDVVAASFVDRIGQESSLSWYGGKVR